MKSLRESLLDNDLVEKTDKYIKDDIEAFLKENYVGVFKISKKPNKDGKYEASSTNDIKVKNQKITSLTNGAFIWTTVDGSFIVRYCDSLNSLEGAPKEVGKTFNCSKCGALISLKGAPEKVGWSFNCANCSSLKSLEGAPEKVGENFNCSWCYSLTSLKGAPREVGIDFDCVGCKVEFTKEDVKKVSKVKRVICY